MSEAERSIELVSRDHYPLIYLLAALDAAGGRLVVPAGDFRRLRWKIVEIEADGMGGVVLSIQDRPRPAEPLTPPPAHGPTREPRTSDR